MKPTFDPMRMEDATLHGLDRTRRRQRNLLTRDQAIGAGLTESFVDNRIRRGVWTAVYPRVYATSAITGDEARLWAAALWAGPESVIAGRAAYFWNGILAEAPTVLTVYLPKRYSRRPQPGIRIVRAEVDRRDTRWRRGLRTTTQERTGLDLARWGELNDYLDVALRRGDVTAASVQACLMRMGTLRGHKKAAAASAQISTNPWSPPERHVHGLLTEAGITGWIANARITTAIGDVSPDIAFPNIKFAVEIEGKRYHDEAVDSKAFERDHRREQALSDVGWIILRFTAKQIEIDPLGVLRSIVRKLEQLTAVFA